MGEGRREFSLLPAPRAFPSSCPFVLVVSLSPFLCAAPSVASLLEISVVTLLAHRRTGGLDQQRPWLPDGFREER